MAQIATGTISGLTAGAHVHIGFVPVGCIIFGSDKRTTIWTDDMTNDTGWKIVDGSDSAVGATSDIIAYTGATPTISSGTSNTDSGGLLISANIVANGSTAYFIAFGL